MSRKNNKPDPTPAQIRRVMLHNRYGYGKPRPAEVSRVMKFIGSKVTAKRKAAARRNCKKARASHDFKYRKLQPEHILDIRRNCPRIWSEVKVFAGKYNVNPTTVLGILDGTKHSDDCLV